jgi:hypothetical protein
LEAKAGPVGFSSPFWGITGVAVPKLEGAYRLPAGDGGDRERRCLLASALVMLYSLVGSAQELEVAEDEQRHAVHQIMLASAALAASEADAFLTLASVGLEAPALVHLRGLGETVRRLALAQERPDLALKLYQSAAPFWKKYAAAAGIVILDDVAGPEMRKLEQTTEFQEARAEIASKWHILNEAEWSSWSKPSHGDICAMLVVADALRNRGEDIRAAVNYVRPRGRAVDIFLTRAVGFCLLGIAKLIEEFSGDDARAAAEKLAESYEALLERDESERGR